MQHQTVSRDEWLTARKALFEKERAMTHALDELRIERRQLPWFRIDKSYVFQGPDGARTLGDLFDGRNQLAIYHFMLTPGSDHICPGCSYTMDHADAARQHFEHADLSFAAISRAPIEQIQAVKARMVGRRRLQLRFWRIVHARGSRGRTCALQFRPDDDPARLGHVRPERFHKRRARRHLPQLLDLSSRHRAADGRVQLARLDAQGPKRNRRHHVLGEASRRVLIGQLTS